MSSKKNHLRVTVFLQREGVLSAVKKSEIFHHFIVVVQSLSHVQLLATPWTATRIFILRTWFLPRFKPLSRGRCLESVVNALSLTWQGMLMGPRPWRENVMVQGAQLMPSSVS